MGGLLFLVICPGGFGVIKILRGSLQPVATALATPGPDVVIGIEKQKGPWGELEISDVQIDPPDEYAAKLYVPASDGVWFFGAGDDYRQCSLAIISEDYRFKRKVLPKTECSTFLRSSGQEPSVPT